MKPVARPWIDALEDGGAHDRVEELDRIGVAQEIDRDEPGGLLSGHDELDAGERRDVAQLAAVAEDGPGFRDRHRVRGQTGEVTRDRAGDCTWAELEHVLRLLGRRLDPLARDRIQHRRHVQRVPARGERHRCSERICRFEVESRPRELEHRGERERGRPDDQRGRVSEQLVEEGRGPSGLGRAGGDDEREREPVEAAREEAEPPDRLQVGPVQVVDDQAGRGGVGDVRCKPVQPVAHRERGVLLDMLSRRWDRGEEGLDECGRAREMVGALLVGRAQQQGLEELPDDAERELGFVLSRARPQHLHPGGGGERANLREQARLPDPGAPLDDDEPPLARPGVVEHRGEHGQLGFTLEQYRRRPPDALDTPCHSPTS